MVMKKTIQPLIVGNWKMNPQSVTMATRLATDLKKGLQRVRDVEVVLAPPAVFISEVRKVRNGSKVFALGAQDAHFEKLGAHTGETALSMLKSFDVGYVIIGHSERRAAGETDEAVNKKINATLKAGMIPVVCVGEKKRDQSAHYLTFIEKQLRSACAGVSKAKLGKLVIAYEPIWAIGTGNTATAGDAHEMKLFIQKVLSDIYGRNMAMKIRVLYGGSANAKNAKELMEEGTVDGLLVGGASLRTKEFVELVKECT